jgi:hypothetical protein
MVSSAGSPRTITVKRRGSKRYAEVEDVGGSRREAGDRSADRDDPCTDPARAKLAPVRAQ